MKTTILIIVSVFALQINLTAANIKSNVPTGKENSTVVLEKPAPNQIQEIGLKENTSKLDPINIEPVTPEEADFSDEFITPGISITDIRPVTPSEADFE